MRFLAQKGNTFSKGRYRGIGLVEYLTLTVPRYRPQVSMLPRHPFSIIFSPNRPCSFHRHHAHNIMI
jgi:hypothetical protein